MSTELPDKREFPATYVLQRERMIAGIRKGTSFDTVFSDGWTATEAVADDGTLVARDDTGVPRVIDQGVIIRIRAGG